MYLLIILGVAVALSCGTVNYVYAVKRKNGTSSAGAAVVTYHAAMMSAMAVVLIFNALLVSSPEFALRLADWKTALIISIIVMADRGAVCAVLGYKYANKHLMSSYAHTISFTMAAMALVFLLYSSFTIDKHVFVVDEASDLEIIERLPAGDRVYTFVLESDLDFSDEELRSEGYGSEKVSYVIDGKGYTVRGIRYYAELIGDLTLFRSSGSDECAVRNLTLADCTFAIAPNSYDNSTHKGLGCGFYFSSLDKSALENVTVREVEIIVKPAVENIRANNLSYVYDELVDTEYHEGDVSLSIKVTREEQP